MINIYDLKEWLVIFFVIAIALDTTAQQNIRHSTPGSIHKTTFGIKGGLNFSNLYVNSIQAENIKTSCNAGFFAKIPVAEKIFFQPEILYTSKGTKVDYHNTTDGSGTYRFNFHYVELPLLMTIQVKSYLSLSAGGYVGFLTSAYVTKMNDDCTVKDTNNINLSDVHRLDNGAVAGISFHRENFMIGLRYELGLRTLGYSSDISNKITPSSKNNTASIFIGVNF
jgi:hypothetical protein